MMIDSTSSPVAGDSIPATQLPELKDTIINISFIDGREQTVRGRLGRKGPSIICNFEITKPATIIAGIVPDKIDCNIRFNQVVMPDNQTDGPFGREINYKLPKKGKYQLIIGHNLMAGDPEACDFTLKLALK